MAYSLVRSTISPTAAASVAPVFGGTPTAGNLLVASVANQTNANVPTVSDSNGNWQAGTANTTGTRFLGHFYQIASASQPTTITAASSTDVLLCNIYEFTGNTIKSLTGLTGLTAHTDNQGTAVTSSSAPPTIVAQFTDSLVFATVGTPGGSISAPGVTNGTSGTFTLGQAGASGGVRVVDAYCLQSVSGSTYNPYFSWTTTRPWYALLTMFVINRPGFF